MKMNPVVHFEMPADGTVLGGQKPGEPDEIPGVGLYASFLDSEGNRVGLLQLTDLGGAPK
jgi:hypothetical protein